MNNVQVIDPRKPHTHKWKVGTFDIETKPVNGESSLLAPFCVGATCTDGTDNTVKYHYYPLTMLQYMLSHKDKVRWFCHNGGGFDFKYIIADQTCKDWLAKAGYRVDIIGGNIAKALMFKRGKKVILLCDSFKLMPASLAVLTSGLGVDTLKGFIDFDEESFDPHNANHLSYLADDVKGLWQVVSKYRGIINAEFGAEIKCTASSTAFACWTTLLNRPIYHHAKMVNDFARQAYYGGRTECFCQTPQEKASYIDVNSLYAYIMLSYGGLHKPYYTRTEDGPGFYRVNASVPIGCKFGPLAFRKTDNTGVLFPCGKFETYASNLEIDIAREMGCDVEVIEGYAYDHWDKDLFKEFINRCMEMRQRDYNGALGQAAKFLQNNLYGFFGMNPVRSEIIYSAHLPEDDDFSPMIDEQTGMQVDGLWERKVYRETLNCIPAFAAWITSAARVHLLRAMLKEEAAGNTVLYCDTDSIILMGEPVNRIQEGEYGAFKLEYTIDRFVGITAKTYMHQRKTDETASKYAKLTPEDVKKLKRKGVVYAEDGTQYTMRCKGIPSSKLSPDMYDRALLGDSDTAEFIQLNSLARVLRTGSLGNENSHRSMPTVRSISTRIPGEDGFTKPIRLPLTG